VPVCPSLQVAPAVQVSGYEGVLVIKRRGSILVVIRAVEAVEADAINCSCSAAATLSFALSFLQQILPQSQALALQHVCSGTGRQHPCLLDRHCRCLESRDDVLSRQQQSAARQKQRPRCLNRERQSGAVR
jgi:hypothetical protein